MKKTVLAVLALLWVSSPAGARSLKPGDKAPEFKLKDALGKVHRLSDYKGRVVILEWTNPGCPYVRKHYDSYNMQRMQKEYTKKGMVWFSVCSSAPGKQGHMTPKQARKQKRKDHSFATALLLDPDGKVGRKYGAKTTPHFFIVDKKGKIAYMGAVDDKPTHDREDIKKARSYVREALKCLVRGWKIEDPSTKPYGCSVKY